MADGLKVVQVAKRGGGGGVCRVGGSVEGVQAVQGAWRRGSQRKGLSRIARDMVL